MGNFSGSFQVDLCCGSDPKNDDKALHIEFRLEQNVIIVNSFENSKWGMEETIRGGLFTPGSEIELEISVQHSKFHVVPVCFQCRFFMLLYFSDYKRQQVDRNT